MYATAVPGFVAAGSELRTCAVSATAEGQIAVTAGGGRSLASPTCPFLPSQSACQSCSTSVVTFAADTHQLPSLTAGS